MERPRFSEFELICDRSHRRLQNSVDCLKTISRDKKHILIFESLIETEIINLCSFFET
jgi:hypothetical protein